MRDHLIQCPLCNNEIPFDTTQCPYCGGLLAPGPTRNAPILKGVICLKCGEKNYSYDECTVCGHPFMITCPECGGEMSLKTQQCPQCGLSLRKFSTTRRRVEKAVKNKPAPDKMTFIIPIAIALLVVLIAVVYTFCSSGSQQGGETKTAPTAGKPKAVDTNADGAPDRWDVFGDNGKVVERRFDANNDKKIERIEFYNESELPTQAKVDEDGDGVYEQIQVYNKTGKLSIAYFYSGSETYKPVKIDRFNLEGNLIERWLDMDSDNVFDRYFRYDAHNRLVMEGSDTKNNGWLDLFLVYHGNKQIYQRMYDLDGDGSIEKTETLNVEGIRIILDEDTDANGLPDKRTLFYLNGSPRWVQTDTDGDGMYDVLKTYTEDGKHARTGTDTNGDAYIDQYE